MNSILSRPTEDQLYDPIIADLNEAKEILSSDYLMDRCNHILCLLNAFVLHKLGAKALLARVLLYTKDYAGAEKETSETIDHSSLSLV